MADEPPPGQGGEAGEGADSGDAVGEGRASLVNDHYKDILTAECKYHAKTERTENEELKDIQDRLTFGELSFANLALILNCCREHGSLGEGAVFIDCGCGIGRQVLSASVLHNFSKCVGIEILEKLDGIGQKVLGTFKEAQEGFPEDVPKGEVVLVKADFVEEVPNHISEEQVVILAVATCYDEKLLTDLSAAITKAPVGSLLVTLTKACPDIEYWDPIHIQQLKCPWGDATLFLHTKVKMPPEGEA